MNQIKIIYILYKSKIYLLETELLLSEKYK